jgi:hypothetical protein
MKLSFRSGVIAATLGLALTLLQVAFALSIAPKEDAPVTRYAATPVPPGWKDSLPGKTGIAAAYLRLMNWDSYHYFDIAENGYKLPSQPTSAQAQSYDANVVFFPGFPIVARLVSRALGLNPEIGVLVASQLCAFAFWTGTFLLLFSWNVPLRGALVAGSAIAMHPAAFFLVTGYSESLFLAALVGFVFWTDLLERPLGKSAKAATWISAAAHGIAMSATRIVGIPAVIYPLFRLTGKSRAAAVSLCGVSALGGLLFLAYCQARFGQWDIYFKLQKLGWANEPGYLAILNPMTYVPRVFFENTVDSMNRAAIPFCLGLLLFGMRLDWRDRPLTSWKRSGLYAVAFLIYYISVSSKASSDMVSMIRLTYPAFVVTVLALAQLWVDSAPHSTTSFRGFCGRIASSRWLYLIIGLSVLTLATQGWMAYRFLRGRWVA